ncbi:putative mitochondrial protein [Cucumis melo var. makuwa]|uniref:Putative mitochondrial protein n=1 Tax=Cucumis melo var. makuwa TaxID=1194695 RepID=A0A5D3C3L4_CUCMM|nr:putative mitochondrial protein [Cucumis melo var. makuwa]
MNEIFHEYLDNFVVVYLDDIVVYSSTMKEHKDHLQMVFQKLKENQLYVKKEKCSFVQQQINFLGHVIECRRIDMEEGKIVAIHDWGIPKSVTLLSRISQLLWAIYRSCEALIVICLYVRFRSDKGVLLKKKSVKEWDDDPSKMKRLIILKIKFKGKEAALKESDGGKVGMIKELNYKKS